MIYTLKSSRFHEIEHTADTGLSGEGKTLPDLFASLAFGMLQIITKDHHPADKRHRQITLREAAVDDLLIRWLSEINYLFLVKHFLPSSITDLKITETPGTFLLRASLYGSDTTAHTDMIEKEIKAVTYHQLAVIRRENRFTARVIFDI
jgi:SHS2 domain-containing protein